MPGTPAPDVAPARSRVPIRLPAGVGRDDSDDRLVVQFLRYLLEARGSREVAERATAGLGLLPEVAWAEFGDEDDEVAGDIEEDLGPLAPRPRLKVHLVATTDAPARARIAALTQLVHAVHGRELEIERLTGEAHTDPLTGLVNRRGLAPFVDQALGRTARRGEQVALLLCDIDHFKSINDSCGHAAGDQALIVVADSMRTVIRPTDVAARLGGDELAILLSGCDAMGASGVAARLRAVVANDNPLHPHPLTLSIGIADQGVLRGIPAAHGRDPLFRRADEALYTAKRQGRDRFVCHPRCFGRGAASPGATNPLEPTVSV